MSNIPVYSHTIIYGLAGRPNRPDLLKSVNVGCTIPVQDRHCMCRARQREILELNGDTIERSSPTPDVTRWISHSCNDDFFAHVEDHVYNSACPVVQNSMISSDDFSFSPIKIKYNGMDFQNALLNKRRQDGMFSFGGRGVFGYILMTDWHGFGHYSALYTENHLMVLSEKAEPIAAGLDILKKIAGLRQCHEMMREKGCMTPAVTADDKTLKKIARQIKHARAL